MSQPRPTGHIFFVILSILAVPFGILVAALTIQAGTSIPTRSSGMFDFDAEMAILGTLIIFVLSSVMAGIWSFIYARDGRGADGSRLWAGIFLLVLALINIVVFNGFVQDNADPYILGVQTSLSFPEAVIATITGPNGWMFFLLLWPIIPILLFSAHWRKARFPTLAMPS